MAGFEDRTTTWFLRGEDVDVIAHTCEVEVSRPKWPRVVGCLALALAVMGVTLSLVGRETASRAAPVAAPTPPPNAAAPPPVQAAVPTPSKLPDEKPLDRGSEWKREIQIGEGLLKKNRNGFALEHF